MTKGESMRTIALGSLFLVCLFVATAGPGGSLAQAQTEGGDSETGHDRPWRPDVRSPRRLPSATPAVIQGFWFQRSYPYHLDYYRQAYGGSYEPYFGFLYGTPAVYAPTYVFPPGGSRYDIYGPSTPGPGVAPPAPGGMTGW